MENRASNACIARSIFVGMISAVVLALAGCGGDSGPAYDPKCPLCEPEDFEDHILQSCPIYYRWDGLFYSWTSCDNAWAPVENQPVFTSLGDCLIAKGHLQDENGTYWDNSQDDKNRGYAWKLFCFNAN
jgi:hypothetical protein